VFFFVWVNSGKAAVERWIQIFGCHLKFLAYVLMIKPGYLLIFILSVFLASCRSVTDHDHHSPRFPVAGRYGELSLALDEDDNVSGVYEFHNGWDAATKDFTQINVFYFQGYIVDSNIHLKTSWPGIDEAISGAIRFFDSLGKPHISMILDEMPSGYASVDFTKEGEFIRSLDKEKNWKQILVANAGKLPVFTQPDSLSDRNASLEIGEIVKVVNKSNGDWLEIECNPREVNFEPVKGYVKKGFFV
jgi:hypothetical protein